MLDSLTLYGIIFKEFFRIGLFSFGGGYATLPFLYDITQRYNWYTPTELSQMVAVASLTPGPVGINVATYAGMKIQGIVTAFIATGAEILPALIIVILISKFLKKFSDNFYVQSALYALKPASCAMLTAIGFKLIKSTLLTPSPSQSAAIILFIAFILISLKKKKDPIYYIALGGFIGITLTLAGFNL